MRKGLFAAIISVLLIIPLTASAVSNPIIHLTFDGVNSGYAVNERKPTQKFTATGVTEVFGYTGSGLRVSSGGGIFPRKGEIGYMIKGVNGVTFSAYVKNDGADSGNLLTVYQLGSKAGIVIEKSGSVIYARAASGKDEALISTSYDTVRDFKKWTYITVGIDFARKMVRFYVDGVHLKTEPAAFVEDAFAFSGATVADKIGDAGIMLDEVRLHPTNTHCSEPMTLYKLDSGFAPEEAYNDVLSDSLVTYFPFDEEGGSEVYSAGGFINAVGHAQKELDFREGIRGNAVVFHPDEKNWINIGSNVTKALSGAKGLTVSGWFYLNKLPGSKTMNRALSLNIIESGALFHLVFRTNGEIAVSVRSGTNTPLCGLNFIKTTSASEVKKNEFEKWHHITVTTDLEQKYMKLFIDGEEIKPNNAEGSNTVNYVNDSFVLDGSLPDATIGGDHAGGQYTKTFNGAIDELRIYNRALTVNEARYIYHENKDGSVMSRDADNYALLNKFSSDMLVVAEGCNEMISGGTRQRINWDNPDDVPEITGSTLFVPADVFDTMSAGAVSEDAVAGTVSIGDMLFTSGSTAYTHGGEEHRLTDAPYIDNGTFYVPFRAVTEGFGKAVSYNCGVAIAGSSEAAELISDGGYATWLYDAMTNLPYTKATSDHMATRSEIYRSELPSSIYPSSPTVARLADGTLVAAHDTIGHGTTIYRSVDDGVTWQKVRKPDADSDDDNIDDTIEEIVYANLFTNTPESTGVESLYLMGVRRGTGEPAAVAVYRSDDGGLTWTTPKDNKTGWIVEDDGTSFVMPAHTAPTPVVKKGGRIYRAFDISGNSWQNYKVVVMSADEDANLLDRDSWTISNSIQLTDYSSRIPSEINCADPGICEANAVIGPDGKVWVLTRFNSAPSVDYGAVLRLSDDNTLEFDRIIKFPGGMSKFTVRYDESTGKYIALANPNTQRDYSLQRLCLAMLVSDDLYNWQIAETLLVPDWLDNWETLTQKNAFQYPDFVFDGDDIAYVVREAGIGAADYHNANLTTFYRIKNYKQYIK